MFESGLWIFPKIKSGSDEKIEYQFQISGSSFGPFNPKDHIQPFFC
ncbi:hypothetical protein Sinme_6959 (plasmid) [Sinorhizobium meliloti AK83]|nr:hypothetical protein Sinme_6959 [Sinorhizobium meliloti AK83]SEJ84839.1 hypothetical protein SAMN04244575_06551 [Sinorhizobium meliloti]